MKKLLILIPVFFYLFSSCTPEDEAQKLVDIITLQPDSVYAKNALLKAKVEKIAKTISEHGFILSKTKGGDLRENFRLVKLGRKEQTGEIKKEVENLEESTTYYVRAFAVSDGIETYGQEVQLTTLSLEEVSPIIEKIIPNTNIKIGDSVTIYGKNFSEEVNVYVGSNLVAAKYYNDTLIKIMIPKISAAQYDVKVIYNSKTSNSVSINIIENTNVIPGETPTSWTDQIPQPPSGFKSRKGAVSFVLNGKAYVGLGLEVSTSNNYLNDFWVFDGTSWSKLETTFPGDFYGAYGSAIVLNNKVYLFFKKQVYEFDGISWVKYADAPASTTNYIFQINNEIYVALYTLGLHKFNPNVVVNEIKGSWSDKLVDWPFKGLLLQGFSFSKNGKGYIGGIMLENHVYGLYSYDPETNSWNLDKKTDTYLPNNLSGEHSVCLTYKDNVYVIGGSRAEGYESKMALYEPTTSTWTPYLGPFLNTISGTGFVLNNEIYVGTGQGLNNKFKKLIFK